MRELQRQRIKHLVEQGGYIEPNHPALTPTWRKRILSVLVALTLAWMLYSTISHALM